MISDRDIYADKDGKITSDPEKFAFQVAVAGVNLDERVAKRYGIADALVSVDEPNAVRRVRNNEPSVKIEKADEKEETKEPQKPVVADEPEEEEAAKSKASVKVVKAAKKGETKK